MTPPPRWENCTELNKHTCRTCEQGHAHMNTVHLGRQANVTVPAVCDTVTAIYKCYRWKKGTTIAVLLHCM